MMGIMYSASSFNPVTEVTVRKKKRSNNYVSIIYGILNLNKLLDDSLILTKLSTLLPLILSE